MNEGMNKVDKMPDMVVLLDDFDHSIRQYADYVVGIKHKVNRLKNIREVPSNVKENDSGNGDRSFMSLLGMRVNEVKKLNDQLGIIVDHLGDIVGEGEQI
jgi:hypothetical protein